MPKSSFRLSLFLIVILIVVSLVLLANAEKKEENMDDAFADFDDDSPGSSEDYDPTEDGPPSLDNKPYEENMQKFITHSEENNQDISNLKIEKDITIKVGDTTVDLKSGNKVDYSKEKGLSVDGKVIIEGANAENVEGYKAEGDEETFESVEQYDYDDISITNGQDIQRTPTSLTIGQADEFRIADTTYTDVTGLVSSGNTTSVQSAGQVENNYISFSNIVNSTFSITSNSIEAQITSAADNNLFTVEYADGEALMLIDAYESIGLTKTPNFFEIRTEDEIFLNFSVPTTSSQVEIRTNGSSTISIEKIGNIYRFKFTNAIVHFRSVLFRESIYGSAEFDIIMGIGITCIKLEPGSDYIYERFLPIEKSFHIYNSNPKTYELCINRQPGDDYGLKDALIDFNTHENTFTKEISYRRYLSNDVYVSNDPKITGKQTMDEENIFIKRLELNQEFPRADTYSDHFNIHEENNRYLKVFSDMAAPNLIKTYATTHESQIEIKEEYLIQRTLNTFIAFRPESIAQGLYEMLLYEDTVNMEEEYGVQ